MHFQELKVCSAVIGAQEWPIIEEEYVNEPKGMCNSMGGYIHPEPLYVQRLKCEQKKMEKKNGNV